MASLSKICRVAVVLIVAMISVPSLFAGTGAYLPAEQQKDPARLISTTHGIDDWLMAAQLKNNSGKTIVAYRIGWVYTFGSRRDFHQGEWWTVTAGISPGSEFTVPAQNVKPNRSATFTEFFVAELKFADGSHWKANKKEFGRLADRGKTGEGAEEKH